MTLSWYGDRCLLLDSDDPLGLAAAVRSSGLEPVDVVPGAVSVLVCFDGPRPARAAEPVLAALRPVPLPGLDELVVLPVVYDGPDLADVAAATGLSEAEVVGRHSAGSYVVAVTGFVPGFAYLAGLDPALHLPRRPDPRTTVPAGSVAIAARWSGVYPAATPGGWHLLGRTAAALWDLDREPPARLRPGVAVRFEPVR